jgi:hypothetical protein
MSSKLFRQDSPGIVFALERFLDETSMVQLFGDYEVVVAAGGNDEHGVIREEGVSYNRRIARILTIVLKEAGSSDFETLRLALYACAKDEVTVSEPALDRDIRAVRASESAAPTTLSVAIVSAALILDRSRHLHMTTMSLSEQLTCVEALGASRALRREVPIPEPLRKKVEYSMSVQKRRLEAESSSPKEGS